MFPDVNICSLSFVKLRREPCWYSTEPPMFRGPLDLHLFFNQSCLHVNFHLKSPVACTLTFSSCGIRQYRVRCLSMLKPVTATAFIAWFYGGDASVKIQCYAMRFVSRFHVYKAQYKSCLSKDASRTPISSNDCP